MNTLEAMEEGYKYTFEVLNSAPITLFRVHSASKPVVPRIGEHLLLTEPSVSGKVAMVEHQLRAEGRGVLHTIMVILDV